MADAPNLFRVTLQVSDLDKAADFYSKLFGANGRRIHGARHYFDCGPVILALLDPTRGGERPRTRSGLHLLLGPESRRSPRARGKARVPRGGRKARQNAGDIVTRPWGERSFYAADPFGNRLCFVDEKTIFTGR